MIDQESTDKVFHISTNISIIYKVDVLLYIIDNNLYDF